jgi:hypothetical protein
MRRRPNFFGHAGQIRQQFKQQTPGTEHGSTINHVIHQQMG